MPSKTKNQMSITKLIHKRCDSSCELCASKENLSIYEVPPTPDKDDHKILICSTCQEQIENPDKMDSNHWRCLNDSMWSTIPAVQVMSWILLHRLKSEGWPQDLLDMLYLDEETLKWAKSTGEDSDEEAIKHIDSNGVVLQNGDSVVLIKDLNVKGASFIAKRGSHVRRISLVHDNAEHIEGKVDGQHIVILTKFVKKSS